jgi:GTP-sensing pleiotropic transcriptional regulator CodY
MPGQPPDLSALADRDCLVTFAAMALCCDNSVSDHEMGYHQGNGTAYITAKGVTRRTGLSRTAASNALQRLEAAGLAKPSNDGSGWRTGTDILTTTPHTTRRHSPTP